MLRNSLTKGDVVQVDPKHHIGKPDSQGGFGYLGFDERTNSWNVSYPVENNRLSPAISPRRLHPTTMATTGRRRKGDTAIGPSLLSHRPKPKRKLQFSKVKAAAASKPATKHRRPMATAELMRLAKSHPKTSSDVNPVITYLLKQRKAPVGWLRQVHKELKAQSSDAAGKTPGRAVTKCQTSKSSGIQTQLTEPERQLVFGLCNTLDMTTDGVYRSIGHAWGQSYKTMMRLVENALDNDDGTLSHDRKPKANSNETVFESLNKQVQVFTAYYVFKKVRRSECCLEDPPTCKEIRKAWEALSASEKAEYEYKAEDCRRRAIYLLEDVTAVLQRTRGSVTWRRLASEVAGSNIPIASHETMRKFVMALPDSAYKTTRMHPKLDESCRYRRYQWARGFWIFWNSAKLCTSIQVVLVHLDEKWFFAIVVRKNNKLVPWLGVEPVHHEIHHKSHIYKEMIAASTAFAPFDNDMERGGVAYKISFERIGRLVAAIKDTFRRVYKQDGSFHYPPILANLLRRKGEEYFRSMEITGSNEGTAKKPKYSLLRFFLDVEIPKLEELAARIESTTGKRAIIRYQLDGAGPHRDSKLLRVLSEEFDKRGWMIKFQPSNSPHTNVKDMCVFPTLSKQVTALQGLSKRSLALEGEELFRLAKQAWDELPESTIARSYAGHHQIVNAIAQSKGGDDFLREKGGLHCGIRQAFVACYKDETSSEPCGVRLVDSYDDVPDDVLQGKQLKYPKPDVSTLDDKYNTFLSKEELEVLEKHLPEGSDEIVSVRQAQHVNFWVEENESQMVSEPVEA
jgi:hypothetical protein